MRGRSTLVLLVVAAALGAYMYFVESKRTIPDENAKEKVFTYDAGTIDQLQVKSETGDVTALKREGSGWTIVKPIEAAADQNTANDIATSLASLEQDRLVDENAADLSAYGLAEPRIDVTFNVAGDKEPKRILIGDKSPTGAGVYAKLPGSSRVFLVGTAADSSLNKSTFDLRDKTALRFQTDAVNSLEIVSKDHAIRLEKTGDDWKIVKPIQAPADYVTVQGLLGQLQSAQMMALKDRPEEIKDLKSFGLDRPDVKATIGVGAQTVVLELGADTGANTQWGRDPSKAAVFSVASGLADLLEKSPFDLRRKELFEFRPFNATRFEIARGNDTRAFERVKGTGENATDTWKQVLPSAKAVDTSNFEGVLLEFSNLRAEGALDRVGPTTGLNNPAAIITVRFDEGKKEERVTIGRTGPDVFAQRSDQPGALKVEMGKYDDAVKKLDAIQ